MAQENVNELQKLSLDEMDSVAGGTWKEVAELIQAFNSNPKMVKANGYNRVCDLTMEDALRKVGIEAKTSAGFFGAGSVNNVYRDKNTGKMLLHEEVIEFLRTGRKTW